MHYIEHGSLQDYFRKNFCPDIRISEYLKILMLNRKKSVKTKSFLESKITNSGEVRTHDLLVTRHENIENVS